jgi:hypothetical protein
VSHEVAADLVAAVGDAGVQQQARRLDAARAEEERRGALTVLDTVADVDHGRHLAGLVELDARDHRLGADLGPVRDGHRQVAGVHADLGAAAAPLVTAAAEHAGRVPTCSWRQSRLTRAAGASVARMPRASQPRIIMSLDALRAGGGIRYDRDGSHG